MEFARVPLPPKMGNRSRLVAGGDRSHERKKGSGTADMNAYLIAT
jgi:hypothetical protein